MRTTALPAPARLRALPWLVIPILSVATLAFWVLSPAFDYRLPADPANPLGNPFHFWAITSAGVLSMTVGLLMAEAGRRRADARVLLLALGLLSAATAVLLHALATPNVLQPGRNVGFVTAAPVGLVMASVFIALSAVELRPEQARAVVAWQGLLSAAVFGFWLLFGVLSLLKLPPFSLAPDPEVIDTPLFFCLIGLTPAPTVQWPGTLALSLAAGLYGFAAARYLASFRRRPGLIPLALAAACVALTVIAVNVGFARTWHLSWWQWHWLVVIAFGLLAFAVYRQYRSEGSARPLFDSLYLEETVARIRQEYGGALESLVEALQRREALGDDAGAPPVSAAVAERFGLSEGQAAVLERAAEALAHEREQIERLGALVAVGQESSVIQEEARLLGQALGLSSAAFRDDSFAVGLVHEGQLDFSGGLRAGPSLPPADAETRARLLRTALRERKPAEEGGALALPLTVKGRPAGVLEVRRARGGFAERDRWLLRSLATQLSVSLENARLYRQIDQLFRQYLPESVATALIADPAQAALGGATREISVMFADLRGFTSLSERRTPPELVALLNRYYGAAAEVVLAQGGTIDKFMGDAMMALFNAPAQQPDHALRACRAALAMQRAIAPLVAEAPDMPRFGIGVNTGEALVGNIGSEAIRNFTAIGDTVNLAARLQARAEGGQVLINASTYAQVREHVEARPLGRIQVKGKEEAVEVFLLLDVR
jgi:class 3 adenylate cyclase